MTTATLEFQPTNQLMVDRETIIQAHAQLLSIIVGKQAAKDTTHLMGDPSARTQACQARAMQELQDSMAMEDPAARAKAMNQVQRKLSSINSLTAFAQLIDECEWD
jgi:predicted carbohydrate-binding protein with CBM5 and CBM33 domain